VSAAADKIAAALEVLTREQLLDLAVDGLLHRIGRSAILESVVVTPSTKPTAKLRVELEKKVSKPRAKRGGGARG
jgi:HD-GYP domain-containing protein (c-di-GMP phosphodiesterase class II)